MISWQDLRPQSEIHHKLSCAKKTSSFTNQSHTSSSTIWLFYHRSRSEAYAASLEPTEAALEHVELYLKSLRRLVQLQTRPHLNRCLGRSAKSIDPSVPFFRSLLCCASNNLLFLHIHLQVAPRNVYFSFNSSLPTRTLPSLLLFFATHAKRNWSAKCNNNVLVGDVVILFVRFIPELHTTTAPPLHTCNFAEREKEVLRARGIKLVHLELYELDFPSKPGGDVD